MARKLDSAAGNVAAGDRSVMVLGSDVWYGRRNDQRDFLAQLSDFFRLIGEWLQFLWPLRKIRQWEQGLLYRNGRYVRTLSPGIYPILPWFHAILTDSVVPGIIQTPRIDITLLDTSMVTLQVSATVRVVDLSLAINTVEAYKETIQELITAVVAEKLAEVDAGRLAPEKRGRLLSDLRRWVGDASIVFGVEVPQLRFTTFVMNPRPYRLLQDSPTVVTW